MRMATSSRNGLLYLLLAIASMTVTCLAAAAADPAVESKTPLQNSVENVQSRESHSLKSDVSYTNYLKAPLAQAPTPVALSAPAAGVSFPSIAQPAVHPASQSIPVPALYSNPQETTMGYVYYYLPQVAEKYYPKRKDLMPYVKRYGYVASRAWQNMPSMRQMADRTFGITSSIGLVLLAPVMLSSTHAHFQRSILGFHSDPLSWRVGVWPETNGTRFVRCGGFKRSF